LDQELGAGVIAERRMLLAQGTEPPQQMGVAAQLREFLQAGEGSVEISEKFAGTAAIVCHGVGPECGGKDLDVGFQDLIETQS